MAITGHHLNHQLRMSASSSILKQPLVYRRQDDHKRGLLLSSPRRHHSCSCSCIPSDLKSTDHCQILFANWKTMARAGLLYNRTAAYHLAVRRYGGACIDQPPCAPGSYVRQALGHLRESGPSMKHGTCVDDIAVRQGTRLEVRGTGMSKQLRMLIHGDRLFGSRIFVVAGLGRLLGARVFLLPQLMVQTHLERVVAIDNYRSQYDVKDDNRGGLNQWFICRRP
ncbi:hypothetical protein FN846DRAFT_893338 [Sphaerosporella brunnea]|uniref:Uncharacterized protein n=1 Tax=Sphaerosporella brunnea TaxID=1250544 RepID=A0A5J5EMX4_9PEZI|nr:hypothetical protein FN846DRAFT_893338 [Sphaerosporella brunnea]